MALALDDLSALLKVIMIGVLVYTPKAPRGIGGGVGPQHHPHTPHPNNMVPYPPPPPPFNFKLVQAAYLGLRPNHVVLLLLCSG